MIEHEGPISGIATFGDRLVATAGYDNQIILWDSRERRALARGCHDHLVNQCEFSADGKLIGAHKNKLHRAIYKFNLGSAFACIKRSASFD